MSTPQDFDRIAQGLRDDDRSTFTFAEAKEWSAELGMSDERPSVVIRELKARGLTMDERQPPRKFRTISSNPHDRWIACPSHGGGGGSSISGLAGQEG